MTPTPDTSPTPDAPEAPDTALDTASDAMPDAMPNAMPDAQAAPDTAPDAEAVRAPAAPPPPGPTATAFAPPPPVGPAPFPPPAPARRSRLGRPLLAGAAAVLVVAAAFGGGFATGRSTAPDGDRLTVELPADWRELPGPGAAERDGGLPSLPGDGGTRDGLPDLERGGRGTDETTPGTGTGDADLGADASEDGGASTSG